MLDMGWAEIGVLFVLALLIFGPDKLPKFAADAAGMIRKLRELAQNAQSGLTDQGIDVDGIKNDLQSVAELHPKRIVGSVMSDLNSATSAVTSTAPKVPKPASEGAASVSAPSTDSLAGTQPEAATGVASASAAEPTASAAEPAVPVKIVAPSSTKIDPDAT